MSGWVGVLVAVACCFGAALLPAFLLFCNLLRSVGRR
jgi:hypothetical protein